MSRTYSLNRVLILIGSLLLTGLMLLGGEVTRSAWAQTLPPRPTLTAQPPTAQPDDGSDEDDDDQETTGPTSAATATLTPTVLPTLTPTPVPPPPVTLPVTGGQTGNGRIWVALGIGLMVSGIGISRAVRFFRGKLT